MHGDGILTRKHSRTARIRVKPRQIFRAITILRRLRMLRLHCAVRHMPSASM